MEELRDWGFGVERSWWHPGQGFHWNLSGKSRAQESAAPQGPGAQSPQGHQGTSSREVSRLPAQLGARGSEPGLEAQVTGELLPTRRPRLDPMSAGRGSRLPLLLMLSPHPLNRTWCLKVPNKCSLRKWWYQRNSN